MSIDSMDRDVFLLYRNSSGLVQWRRMRPISLFWGNSHWHTETQWLMHAFDPEKKEQRTLAMKDILEWRDKAPESPAVQAYPAGYSDDTIHE